jgi:hypothetical protein
VASSSPRVACRPCLRPQGGCLTLTIGSLLERQRQSLAPCARRTRSASGAVHCGAWALSFSERVFTTDGYVVQTDVPLHCFVACEITEPLRESDAYGRVFSCSSASSGSDLLWLDQG